jgi:hypothetical protein
VTVQLGPVDACGGVRAGLAYLSDERIALELESGLLHGYAKAIEVSRRSFAALLRDFCSQKR